LCCGASTLAVIPEGAPGIEEGAGLAAAEPASAAKPLNKSVATTISAKAAVNSLFLVLIVHIPFPRKLSSEDVPLKLKRLR